MTHRTERRQLYAAYTAAKIFLGYNSLRHVKLEATHLSGRCFQCFAILLYSLSLLWRIYYYLRYLWSDICHCIWSNVVYKRLKSQGSFIALNGNPSQSYGASPAVWDHTVLPATRHRWTRPAITPAIQAGARFNYPRGMAGWVDLGGWLHS